MEMASGQYIAGQQNPQMDRTPTAINSRNRISDTANYDFVDKLGLAIAYTGKIILDMAPHYYDTKRVIRIIGEDGEIQTAQLDPDQQTSYREVRGADGGIESIYNPGVGKWDVSITTGPSYNTKRMENQATFVEMAKGAADPASAAVLRYLVMRNSDAAGSEEASKLLKTLLPPQALQAIDSKEPIPPRVQAMLQQVQGQMQQMQEEGQKLQQENVQLKAGAQVQAMKVQADQQAARAEFAIQKQKQDGELRLAREKAIAEINLKREVAEAELRLEAMKAGLDADASVDAAINKVVNLATVHQTKIQAIFDKETAQREAKAEGEEKAQEASDSAAQVQALHSQFIDAVGQIIDALQNQKKSISLKMPDGRTATAEVTAH